MQTSGEAKLVMIIGTEIVPFYYEAFCAVWLLKIMMYLSKTMRKEFSFRDKDYNHKNLNYAWFASSVCAQLINTSLNVDLTFTSNIQIPTHFPSRNQ